MALHATRVHKNLFAVTVCLFLFLLLAISAQAQTQITTCGTRINQPGNYVLANNLTCDGVDGIDIDNVSSVELHLNEHRITGSDTGNGIKTVAAIHVSIFGPGRIQGFSNGVLNDNSIVNVNALTVTGTANAGFLSRGDSNVTWTGNLAEKNPVGFVLLTGTGKVALNSAMDNADDGFVVGGDHVGVVFNTARNNGAIGIVVTGTSNTIYENHARDNARFDLADENPDCDHNNWLANEFGTSNQDCIH